MLSTRAFGRTACLTAALTVALTLSGCSGVDSILSSFSTPSVGEAKAAKLAASTSSLSSANLVTDGVLTVGLTSSSTPLVIESSDGSYEGYDIDVAGALANSLGLSVSFVSVSNLSDAVGTTCDVVMNVSSTHASGLTIAGSYVEDATAFFAKSDATESSDGSVEAVAASAISGKTVGVQTNSTSQQLLQRSDLETEQSMYANLNDAFQALEDGSVDYVLCDAVSGSYLAGLYSDINLVATLDVPESIGIATSASNAELQTAVQEALSKLNSNGIIELIRDKWLNGMPTLTSSSQVEGITISSGTTTGSDEEATGTDQPQDGSTAGANAVDIG